VKAGTTPVRNFTATRVLPCGGVHAARTPSLTRHEESLAAARAWLTSEVVDLARDCIAGGRDGDSGADERLGVLLGAAQRIAVATKPVTIMCRPYRFVLAEAEPPRNADGPADRAADGGAAAETPQEARRTMRRRGRGEGRRRSRRPGH